MSDVPHKLVPILKEVFELLQDDNNEIGEMQGIMVAMAMGETREQAPGSAAIVEPASR